MVVTPPNIILHNVKHQRLGGVTRLGCQFLWRKWTRYFMSFGYSMMKNTKNYYLSKSLETQRKANLIYIHNFENARENGTKTSWLQNTLKLVALRSVFISARTYRLRTNDYSFRPVMLPGWINSNVAGFHM